MDRQQNVKIQLVVKLNANLHQQTQTQKDDIVNKLKQCFIFYVHEFKNIENLLSDYADVVFVGLGHTIISLVTSLASDKHVSTGWLRSHTSSVFPLLCRR